MGRRAARRARCAVLDAETGDADRRRRVRPGGAPVRLALGALGLWVADAAAGAVIPMQLRPPRTFASLQPGADANDVVLAGGAVWIASSADGRVYVIEPGGGAARPLPAGRARSRSPPTIAASSPSTTAAGR